MGQKVNPVGFRVGVNHAWGSRWFAPKKSFGAFLVEDQRIRDLCKKRLVEAGISRIMIERYANRVRVTLFSARPGVIIGRKGGDVEATRDELSKMTGKEVYLEVKEVQGADADAQLVAESIALQLERRIMLKRAMKRAMKVAMDMGVDGINPCRRPHQRRGDRARRMVPRGQGAASHASREHRLWFRGGQHHGRQDRSEGVDMQEGRVPGPSAPRRSPRRPA